MRNENDLFTELELAQAECARLREENEELKRRLLTAEQWATSVNPFGVCSVSAIPTDPNQTISVKAAEFVVTNASEPNAKIDLFRRLFRGREDIYAVRWVGRNGKPGYSPAAPRSYGESLKARDYRKSKCFPLTDDVVRDHLLGKHTVGIYPLLLDETCWFLAVDFYKRAWQADVLAFLTTCREFGLPAVLERSRSGDGGHVWLFFDCPISASTARKIYSSVIE